MSARTVKPSDVKLKERANETGLSESEVPTKDDDGTKKRKDKVRKNPKSKIKEETDVMVSVDVHRDGTGDYVIVDDKSPEEHTKKTKKTKKQTKAEQNVADEGTKQKKVEQTSVDEASKQKKSEQKKLEQTRVDEIAKQKKAEQKKVAKSAKEKKAEKKVADENAKGQKLEKKRVEEAAKKEKRRLKNEAQLKKQEQRQMDEKEKSRMKQEAKTKIDKENAAAEKPEESDQKNQKTSDEPKSRIGKIGLLSAGFDIPANNNEASLAKPSSSTPQKKLKSKTGNLQIPGVFGDSESSVAQTSSGQVPSGPSYQAAQSQKPTGKISQMAARFDTAGPDDSTRDTRHGAAPSPRTGKNIHQMAAAFEPDVSDNDSLRQAGRQKGAKQ